MQSRGLAGALHLVMLSAIFVGVSACGSSGVQTLGLDPDPETNVATDNGANWVVTDGAIDVGISRPNAGTEDGGLPLFQTERASELTRKAEPTATNDPASTATPESERTFVAPVVVKGPDDPDSDVSPGSTTNTEMIAAVRSGVAAITARECGDTRNGTGFVVSEHHLLTAAHGVATASSIRVTTEEVSQRARLVAADEELDLALLWVPKAMSGWQFAFDATVWVGEEAVFLEYANSRFGVTEGSIIAIDDDSADDNSVLEFDITATSGASGAPVVDSDGEVIGVLNQSRPDREPIAHALGARSAQRFVDANTNKEPQRPPRMRCGAENPPALDTVQGGDDHRQGEQVERFFGAYVVGINAGRPQDSWDLLSENLQSSIGGYDRFADGNKTSRIRDFTVESIVDTDTGLAVDATFVSTQDPADGPNGWTCAAWSMRYELVADDEYPYLIDSARNRPGSPAPCDSR